MPRFTIVLIGFLSLIPLPIAAQGTTPTAASIVQALQPQNTGPLVRSLSPQVSRGIGIEGPLPEEIDLPAIDLTVNFEFNSVRLTTDAMLVLRALGAALEHESLADARFQVGGHTDGVGGEAFNLDLSNRRAAEVVTHLTAFYNITPDRLTAVGYGESQLLYPDIPESEFNRRVTVTNVQPLLN